MEGQAKQLVRSPEDFVQEVFEKLIEYPDEDQNKIIVGLHNRMVKYRNNQVENQTKRLEYAESVLNETPFGH